MELKFSDNVSVKYHAIFDYKLTKDEAIRWQYKQSLPSVEGKNQKSKRQLQREKYSQKKLVIAKKAANLISIVPTVKFIGITGALAMMNVDRNSDIDLMIITKNNTLWTTRFLVYVLLKILNIKIRKPQNKNEENALCLNMWLDENYLIWDKKDRNIYTAHEIAQIVPIINKDKTYERFLSKNNWILNYWPNAVNMPYALSSKLYAKKTIKHTAYSIMQSFESIAFNLQYQYMKPKITREIVTSKRAVFHPNDWGKIVMKKLKI